jgi:hypothetical protein
VAEETKGPLSRLGLAYALIDLTEDGYVYLDTYRAAMQVADAAKGPDRTVVVSPAASEGWWRVDLWWHATTVDQGLVHEIRALGFDVRVTSPPWDDR